MKPSVHYQTCHQAYNTRVITKWHLSTAYILCIKLASYWDIHTQLGSSSSKSSLSPVNIHTKKQWKILPIYLQSRLNLSRYHATVLAPNMFYFLLHEIPEKISIIWIVKILILRPFWYNSFLFTVVVCSRYILENAIKMSKLISSAPWNSSLAGRTSMWLKCGRENYWIPDRLVKFI
jgi:hypothetical protein